MFEERYKCPLRELRLIRCENEKSLKIGERSELK